jgi:hypothetical protein
MPGLRTARPGRTKKAGTMNKLEEAYSWVLEARKRAGELQWWTYEAITLKLADGVRYTPDFTVLTIGPRLEFHEVKGYMRDDARVKLKVAAAMFPFKFLLVRKSGRGWEITEV